MLGFKRNMSNTDRIARTAVGLVLLALGSLLNLDMLSTVLLGLVGAMAIFSALTAHCMLYAVTGFGSCEEGKAPD
jgi:hypothetical protein